MKAQWRSSSCTADGQDSIGRAQPRHAEVVRFSALVLHYHHQQPHARTLGGKVLFYHALFPPVVIPLARFILTLRFFSFRPADRSDCPAASIIRLGAHESQRHHAVQQKSLFCVPHAPRQQSEGAPYRIAILSMHMHSKHPGFSLFFFSSRAPRYRSAKYQCVA